MRHGFRLTDAKLNDLMEEFMWNGCGDALGSLIMKYKYHTLTLHVF